MEFIKEGMVIVKHSHGLVATIVAASLVATFISPTTSIAYAQPAAPINGAGASATSTTPAKPEDNPIGTQGDPNAQPGSPSTEPKAQPNQPNGAQSGTNPSEGNKAGSSSSGDKDKIGSVDAGSSLADNLANKDRDKEGSLEKNGSANNVLHGPNSKTDDPKAKAEPSSYGPFAHFLRTILASGTNAKSSTGKGLKFLLGLLNLLGLGHWKFPDRFRDHHSEYPLPTDDSITELKVVDKQDEFDGRVQRWSIQSPTMKRIVEVEVMAQPNAATPAPMLYLLDGVSAPRVSGWFGPGDIINRLGNENVTVVAPTQGNGSFYADWSNTDPSLGYMKWETFITEELPRVLEAPQADSRINFNGKRGIGGLSMGASGAVRIAAKNPNLFHGVFGLSGCYSTVSQFGRTTIESTIKGQDGNPSNIWGPFGSSEWRANDVTLHPEGLRSMPVFLSNASGKITKEQLQKDNGLPFYDTSLGATLEHVTLECTKDLEKVMDRNGMTNKKVVYIQSGIHRWNDTFTSQILPAWEYLKPSLQ